MPKININEKDFTTPGASSNYANYAVLVTGFEGDEPTGDDIRHKISGRLKEYRLEDDIQVYNRPVAPDSNGVYEFTSAQDFTETIGLASPRRVLNPLASGDTQKTTYNYGNRVAYELLNLGFAVLYKPIKSQAEVYDQKTWEIFKDKVSYDFRFITHGLLESDDTPLETSSIAKGYLEAKRFLISLAQYFFEGTEEDKNNDGQKDWDACCPTWKEYLKIETAPEKYIESDYDPIARWKDLPYIAPESKINDYTDLLILERSFINNEDPNMIFTCTEDDKLNHWKMLQTQLSNAFLNNLCPSLTAFINKHFNSYFSTAKSKKAQVLPDEITFVTVWNALGIEIDKLYVSQADLLTCTRINKANRVIADLATYIAQDGNADEMAVNSGRGDCLALLELDEKIYTNHSSYKKPEQLIIDDGLKKLTLSEGSGTYCALTVPSVYYTSLENEATSAWEGNNKMPAAFHYLACFIRALRQNYAEWYATAGYTRGVSSLVIDHTSVRLGELAINALEPRYIKNADTEPPFACNVIANFRGSYYLWGNRTCAPLGAYGSRENGDLVASHFLNIRQLCITIKKKLFNACRQFTFDPNSDVLWVNFCNAIRPTLELMRADQGIRDYKIIRVETDRKATLKAKIRIIPIEAVEDFILEVSLDDDFGATITG